MFAPRAMLMARAARPGVRAFAAAAATPRPFRVLGVQQVAIGGPSKGALQKLWVDTFGLEKVTSFKSEKENVDEDVLRAGRGEWAVEIDIMQPIDAEKSPKVHLPPLNHLGLWIDDLPKAVEWMTANGLRMAPGGIRRGASGFDVAFMHPKSTEGVLIELVQAPPSLVEAYNKLK
jgi:lactoylglutathione lyase